MKCPEHNVPTRIVDTRQVECGVRRMHVCPSGHRFTTLEAIEELQRRDLRKQRDELYAVLRKIFKDVP